MKRKFSDRFPSLARALAVLAGVLLVTGGLVYLVDEALNGFVADLFYNTFIWTRQDPVSGALIREPYWPALKSFLIVAFLLAALVVALVVFLAAHFYGKRRAAREVAFLSDCLRRYFAPGGSRLALPAAYAEFENQMRVVDEDIRLREEAMARQTAEKNDLITYLAHDLKTPLASVIGYLSLLDESPDLPAPQRRKYVRVTLDRANRLEQLVEEFFDITRFNLHAIALTRTRLDLPLLLRQLADEFYPLLAPAGKRVTVDAEEGLTLRADPDKLARVFDNLLKNAAAYSDPGTEIALCARREQNRAVVTVTDTGAEIPPQKLEMIFEKFYRLDSSRSTGTGGAGLGLSIARQIVEAHGGELAAESRGGVTVFTVRLPL